MDVFKAGEEILNSVSDAINSGDYSDLNRTIKNTVRGGASGNYWSVDTPGQEFDGYRRSSSTTRRTTTYTTRSSSQRRGAKTTAKAAQTTTTTPSVYVSEVPGSFLGPFLASVGYGGAVLCGTTLALITAISSISGGSVVRPLLFTAVTVAGFSALGTLGMKLRARAKRFVQYVKTMKGRDYASIDELSRVVQKPIPFVIKDVRQMIAKNFFIQGRLDEKETTLLGTDAVYQQYLLAQQSQKEREAKEAEEKQREESIYSRPGMTEESKKLLKEGNDYIRRIRECNDAIPGEDVTAKLYRLEEIMTRIFKQVEVQPELTQDLRKFMNYYLPTTLKLVEAYRELDQQTVEGENITKTKHEIEETLDTINEAFETLLDSFFEEKAWDISSDINVMKNQMKQDGMTSGEFQTMTK